MNNRDTKQVREAVELHICRLIVYERLHREILIRPADQNLKELLAFLRRMFCSYRAVSSAAIDSGRCLYQ